jgi:ADP-ribose pyrophosphatase
MTGKIKEESDVFKTRLFTVKRIVLSQPDGKSRDYDFVDIQNAVTILPIDDEGNVYFVKQYRIGSRSELLELPAGKIEKNENPSSTAERELREETGMASREMIHLGNFYMSPGYASEYMYCYLARGLFQAPLTPDPDEFLNVLKLPLIEVRRMVEEKLIEDSKTLAVFMLAQKYLPALSRNNLH